MQKNWKLFISSVIPLLPFALFQELQGMEQAPTSDNNIARVLDLAIQSEGERRRNIVRDLGTFSVPQTVSAPQTDLSAFSYETIEKVFNNNITYSPGHLYCNSNDIGTFSYSRPPQKARTQAELIYDKNPTPVPVPKSVPLAESVLMPGKDGRVRIPNTDHWPHSIHAHLDMLFEGTTFCGSGVIVGPHHVLTCGHNVYHYDEKMLFEKICVYPALNENVAPFHKANVTKAYMFKNWREGGTPELDIALLLLDRPIGDYAGWGGLLSTPNEHIFGDSVNITGYPSDKGEPSWRCKQMWTMRNSITKKSSEVFEYKIDTAPGQSGSAIWVNASYDAPMILGVHTRGALPGFGSMMNSGVRLSEEKFKKICNIISSTLEMTIPIPSIAREYEQSYQRFSQSTLIYTPVEGSNDGQIVLPIADLANPLEGTFNLSRCGDAGKYLSISTGYRKGKKEENAGKVEIWLAPRFLIEREVPEHLQDILRDRDKFNNLGWHPTKPFGVFWTWGGRGQDIDSLSLYAYHATSTDTLGLSPLYEKWTQATRHYPLPVLVMPPVFERIIRKFHISFS